MDKQLPGKHNMVAIDKFGEAEPRHDDFQTNQQVRNEQSIMEVLTDQQESAEFEDSLPVWEPQFEECTDAEIEPFMEFLEKRKEEVEQWAKTEAFEITAGDSIGCSSTDDQSQSVDEEKQTGQETKQKFQAMRGKGDIDEREVIVAENFVTLCGSCCLYTYWEYSPEEAGAALQASSALDVNMDTIKSGEKQIYFLCAADDFVLQIGLNPAFQEVLLFQTNFPPELAEVLLRRGWVQRQVDFDEDDPYARFNLWSIVYPRLLQIRQLHAKDTSPAQDNTTIGKGGEQLHRSLIQKQLLRSTFSGSYLASCGRQDYRVFTRDGMLPLRCQSQAHMAKRLSRGSQTDFPLKKRARLRWVVARGKVLKRKRNLSEKLLSTRPQLSPVPEVRSLASTPSCSSRAKSASRLQVHTPDEIPRIVIMEINRAYCFTDQDEYCEREQTAGETGGTHKHHQNNGGQLTEGNSSIWASSSAEDDDDTIVYEEVEQDKGELVMDDEASYCEVERGDDPSMTGSELYEDDDEAAQWSSPNETVVLRTADSRCLGKWV